MNTEAWWVCGTCGKKLARVGKKNAKPHQTILAHRKECTPTSGAWIKQIPQGAKR